MRIEKWIEDEEMSRQEDDVVIYDESRVGDVTECNIYIFRPRSGPWKMEMHSCYAFQF
jgi:hypothetical protein